MFLACHLRELETAVSPRRRKLPTRPRREPVGPWGEYVNDLRVRKGWSYKKMYDPVNAAAEDDGEPNTSYGRHTIRNWIGGVVPTSADTLRWIANGWNEPIETVSGKADAHRTWRYERRAKAAEVEALGQLGEAPTRSPARDTLDPHADTPALDEDEMKRRRFLAGATAGFLAVLKPGAYERLRPLMGIAADRGRAEHFLIVRKALADSDNLFGPQQAIPTARLQVTTMQQIRPTLRGSDLRELLHVQTQFADLLGWLHQDVADFPASQYWMDRALEWAHLAGDHDSVVFVLARKSQLAGDMQDPIEAVDAAEAAIAMATPRNRLAAIAATYAGHGHALRGDRGMCDQLYDQARSLLDRADKDESPWGMFFDAAYIAAQHARSLSALGDHRNAAEAFRAAIDNLQAGYHRDRGVYLAREALAYANMKEAEHAADLGLQALAIGTETNSVRILAHLADLDHALQDCKATREVANFHYAMIETGLRQS